jgi:hypothetical protein
MLGIGDANGDGRVTVRAATLGFAVGAMLVALAALAQEARSEPQFVPSQAPGASPAAAEPPTRQSRPLPA